MSSLGSAAGGSVPPGTPEFGAASDGVCSEPAESLPSARFFDDSSLSELIVELMEIIPAEGMAIALADGTHFVCRASAGSAPRVGTAIVPGIGLCGQCIQKGTIIRDQQIEGELGSLLAIPITDGKQTRGCIAAFSSRQLAFRELDIEQLVAISYHLGVRKKVARDATAESNSGKPLPKSVESVLESIDTPESKVFQIGYAEILKEELADPVREVVNGEHSSNDTLLFRAFEAESPKTSRTLIAIVLGILILGIAILAAYYR